MKTSQGLIELADWFEERADEKDAWADGWEEGSAEAIEERREALKLSQCATAIRGYAASFEKLETNQ